MSRLPRLRCIDLERSPLRPSSPSRRRRRPLRSNSPRSPEDLKVSSSLLRHRPWSSPSPWTLHLSRNRLRIPRALGNTDAETRSSTWSQSTRRSKPRQALGGRIQAAVAVSNLDPLLLSARSLPLRLLRPRLIPGTSRPSNVQPRPSPTLDSPLPDSPPLGLPRQRSLSPHGLLRLAASLSLPPAVVGCTRRRRRLRPPPLACELRPLRDPSTFPLF